MGRGFSTRTYIRQVLDKDAALPDDSPQKMTPEQRLETLQLLARAPRLGVPKGTKPSTTGKIKKKSRYLSDEDIQRLRGAKPPKPASEGTLGDFLTDAEESKVDTSDN